MGALSVKRTRMIGAYGVLINSIQHRQICLVFNQQGFNGKIVFQG